MMTMLKNLIRKPLYDLRACRLKIQAGVCLPAPSALYDLRACRLKKHGKNVRIPGGCFLYGNIECGSNVSIGQGACFVSTMAKLIIHDYVVFGPNVSIYTGDHATNIIGKHISEITDQDKILAGGGTILMSL